MRETILTFTEHLEELRARIIKSVLFIIIVSAFLYAFRDVVLSFVVKPVGRLVFIAPQEAFITNVKIAFFGGLFLTSPFIFYQIWEFVSSGLGRKERGYVLLFGLFSFIFFIFGSFLGYFIIVPVGINFLLRAGTEFVTPMITVGRYVSFCMSLCLAFGVIFQVPLVILFLTKSGIITPKFLSDKRKYIIVAIFILAAVLTPPDVVTQCLMALPLIVLFEASILVSKLAHREKDR